MATEEQATTHKREILKWLIEVEAVAQQALAGISAAETTDPTLTRPLSAWLDGVRASAEAFQQLVAIRAVAQHGNLAVDELFGGGDADAQEGQEA